MKPKKDLGSVGRVLLATLLLSGCAVRPSEADARKSFANRVSQVDFIRQFRQEGDDLLFEVPAYSLFGQLLPDRPPAGWKVHIERITVTGSDGDYKAQVQSSWLQNGRTTNSAHIPMGFGKLGVGPESSATWSSERKEWNW